MTDGGWGDECTLDDHAGSLLSRDAGDRRALLGLAEAYHKLLNTHTEARRDCTSMMTVVRLSIERCKGRGRFRQNRDVRLSVVRALYMWRLYCGPLHKIFEETTEPTVYLK